MGKIILRLLFILSLSFNIAFTAHLFLSPKKSPARDESIKELNLTKEQQEKIRSASAAIDRENRELSAKVAECREELLKVLQAREVDKEKASQCIKDISVLQQQIQENTIKKILISKQHLSHEQCRCFMDNIGKKMHVHPDCCPHDCKEKK
ncbi:MAG: periplasmic heavy metal sensor [Candidatus Aminicenantes bacterium]|nr:periplasmic heavy metal sensor [Candidatus Aminicenantes bacterium]